MYKPYLGVFYTLCLTISHTFTPAGNSKCFRQSATPASASIHRHKATALEYYIAYNRNKTVKGTGRGCQNIMGFSGEADQGRNARHWSGIEAQRQKCR